MTFHSLLFKSSSLVDLDVIRTFIEDLDFSVRDHDDKDLLVDQSWKFFVFSTFFESDEAYDVVDTKEGEKIFPRKNSICQLLLDVLGSDIRKNLTSKIVDEIWSCASSSRFLKWFMASTDSETLTVCKETGRSPIRYMVSTWNNSRFQVDFKTAIDKVEFLIGKGASLHYSENDESITQTAMRGATNWLAWGVILKQLKVDIPSFFEKETISWPLRVWSKEELMMLFYQRHSICMTLEKYKWDEEPLSSNDADRIPSFWLSYLIFLQNSKLEIRERKEPDDDQDRTSEDRPTGEGGDLGADEGGDLGAGEGGDLGAGEGIGKNDDVDKDDDVGEDDDVDEIDNVDKDENADEDAWCEVYGLFDICYQLYQNWKENYDRYDDEFPMPGSFIS